MNSDSHQDFNTDIINRIRDAQVEQTSNVVSVNSGEIEEVIRKGTKVIYPSDETENQKNFREVISNIFFPIGTKAEDYILTNNIINPKLPDKLVEVVRLRSDDEFVKLIISISEAYECPLIMSNKVKKEYYYFNCRYDLSNSGKCKMKLSFRLRNNQYTLIKGYFIHDIHIIKPLNRIIQREYESVVGATIRGNTSNAIQGVLGVSISSVKES